MGFHSRLLALAAAGMLLAGGAEASTLYAVNYSGVTPLYTLDQSTGAATTVGGSITDVGDLTSGSGMLWGVSPLSTNGDNLIRINPATGAVMSTTPIMNAAGGVVDIVSLAYDPVTNVLYGNTSFAYDGSPDTLYTIDPTTGMATLTGGIGFNDVYALGFDQTGALFGVATDANGSTNGLIGIDTSTGAGSSIATLSTYYNFDIASRPEDNMMFLVDSGTESLYTLDTSTGAETLVGPWNGPTNLVGLAFLSGGTSVPEPATLTLFLFGAAGLGFARRKRAKN